MSKPACRKASPRAIIIPIYLAKVLLNWRKKTQDIVAITAAMTEGTGLKSFRDKFPARFYDIGIAEQHALSFAAGLANAGKKPIFAVYSSFLQRGYDQLMEDICLQKLPVVISLDRSGIVGSDGFTHQGIYDLSYLRTIPGLTVMAPASGEELFAMLEYAFELAQPVVIRYPKGDAAKPAIDCPPLELGKSQLISEARILPSSVSVNDRACLESCSIAQGKGNQSQGGQCQICRSARL